MQQQRALVVVHVVLHGNRLAVRDNLQLQLLDVLVHRLLQRRQTALDVIDEDLIQFIRQIGSAAHVRYLTIRGVRFEEQLLRRLRRADRLLVDDILLRPIHHPNVAQLQRDNIAAQHRQCIGAGVHQINLGDHAQGAYAGWIHLFRQLNRVRRRQVRSGRRHCQDQTVLLRDERADQFTNATLDVGRLILDGHSRHSRQVDQGQSEHCRRVNLEIDWIVRNRFVGCHALRLFLNLAANLVKIIVTFSASVQELAPRVLRL
mmetsp:Transcript_881/g.1694  ORF Transcript_881/g.1694 Transcript_881/m.1694 type:complete len:260 (-) Transcript_881:348-1127(-)